MGNSPGFTMDPFFIRQRRLYLTAITLSVIFAVFALGMIVAGSLYWTPRLFWAGMTFGVFSAGSGFLAFLWHESGSPPREVPKDLRDRIRNDPELAEAQRKLEETFLSKEIKPDGTPQLMLVTKDDLEAVDKDARLDERKRIQGYR